VVDAVFSSGIESCLVTQTTFADWEKNPDEGDGECP